jgi:hypothetical protein
LVIYAVLFSKQAQKDASNLAFASAALPQKLRGFWICWSRIMFNTLHPLKPW